MRSVAGALIFLGLIVVSPLSAQETKYRLPVEIDHAIKVQIEKEPADTNAEESDRKFSRDHDNSDLQAQWLAAKSADRMVWLSIAQLIGTAVTVGIAFYSIKLSRDALLGESMPIFVTEAPVLPYGANDYGEGRIAVDWKVNNKGRGTGFVTGNVMILSTLQSGHEARRLETPTQTSTYWPIAVGEWWAALSSSGNSLPFDVSKIDAIEKDEATLYFYGELQYQSAGKKRGVMRCAFKYQAHLGRFVPHADEAWWKDG